MENPWTRTCNRVRIFSGNCFVLDFLPQDFVNKCPFRPRALTVSPRPRQIFYQTKGRRFSSFINSSLREVGSKRASKTLRPRVKGSDSAGTRSTAAELLLPLRTPNPGRVAQRQCTGRGGRPPLRGYCRSPAGHDHRTRCLHSRPAGTELARDFLSLPLLSSHFKSR